MGRLIQDCGWKTLDTIGVENFIRWRQTATAKVGTSAKVGANSNAINDERLHRPEDLRYGRSGGETSGHERRSNCLLSPPPGRIAQS
jgi:hypothetical protein